MTRGEIILALLRHTFVARARPEHALARVTSAVSGGAAGLRGPRGDADAAARAILGLGAGSRPGAAASTA